MHLREISVTELTFSARGSYIFFKLVHDLKSNSHECLLGLHSLCVAQEKLAKILSFVSQFSQLLLSLHKKGVYGMYCKICTSL